VRDLLEVKKATKEALWNCRFTLLAHCFAQIGYQVLVPSLPIYLEHLGKSDQLIGMLISVFAFTAILSRSYIGRALDRFNRKYIYMIGLVCNMLVSFLYGFVETSLAFIILRLFHGGGLGVTTVAVFTIVTDFIDPKRMAEGMGVSVQPLFFLLH
jgi:MFS family permease